MGHIVGASIVFFGGVAFCWVQLLLSYIVLKHKFISYTTFVLRFTFALFSLFFLTSMTILESDASREWNKNPPDHGEEMWDPKDPGYLFHLLSNISEWLMVLSMVGYFITFASEFNRIKMDFNVTRRYVNISPLQRSSSDASERGTRNMGYTA